MEEVDNIIIDSLKNLNCSIDEDILSLNQFTPEMVTNYIVACLECIIPDIKLCRSLPPSMSLRLKIATNLAEQIKKLGYRGDMGYQTILYCNEVDIRRVFMFLIERLPKETSKVVSNEDVGYVARLVKQIERNIQISLEKPWVPINIIKDGVRNYNGELVKQSFGSSIPLKSVELDIPNLHNEATESVKNYWIHNMPLVTKQCEFNLLIPSLLFHDNEYTYDENYSLGKTLNTSTNIYTYNIEENLPQITDGEIIKSNTSNNLINETINENISEMDKMMKEIELHKNEINTSLQEYKNKEITLNDLMEKAKENESVLSNTLNDVKVKSKALNVLAKDENLVKLKNLVEASNDRLVDLANQWNDIQSPLLEQYQTLRNSLSSQEIKLQEKQEKSNKIKEKLKYATEELKEKERLELQLIEENSRMNRNTNRSVYTRKILEIIGNIKKQDEEIKKILKDTKDVQKDINNLNGQLDRSFILSDELIFRDAKNDEMARKAYKLLAGLHKDCNEIVAAISNLGILEREYRNLEEQVESEISKEYGTKLERVNKDLLEIKKEIASLIKENNIQ